MSQSLRQRATATGTDVSTQQREPSLGDLIERMKPEIARVLPAHLDPDRFTRIALTLVRKTPALAQCSPASFLGALMTCSELGLEPGVGGEAYLVPYKKECTLIIGYQGYAKLFWQSPLAKHLDAQAVYANDDFDYAYGLDPFLRHKPALGDRGEVVAYYAAASLTNGGKAFVVLSPAEVKALRGGKAGPSGNIADPTRWMERKTALRQLVKLLPKSATLTAAMRADETVRTDLSAPLDAVDLHPAIEGQRVDTATGEVTEQASGDVDPNSQWDAPSDADQ